MTFHSIQRGNYTRFVSACGRFEIRRYHPSLSWELFDLGKRTWCDGRKLKDVKRFAVDICTTEATR